MENESEVSKNIEDGLKDAVDMFETQAADAILQNCIKKLSTALGDKSCPECGAVTCSLGCHDEDDDE